MTTVINGKTYRILRSRVGYVIALRTAIEWVDVEEFETKAEVDRFLSKMRSGEALS